MQRDLSLPMWGPYSRHYMGISKLLDHPKGRQMVDFTLVPGFMRGKVIIPDVNFDAAYHPWLATPDFSYYSVRYEMAWKDEVYCDAEYFPCAEGELVKLTYVNNTPLAKSMTATLFAVHRYFARIGIQLQADECWMGGEQYAALDYVPPREQLQAGENYETFCHLNYLNMGHDGLRRGVAVQETLVDACGLGNRISPAPHGHLTIENNRTFLFTPGSSMAWHADGKPHSHLYLRISMAGIDEIMLDVDAGGDVHTLLLRGDDFAESEDMLRWVRVDLDENLPVDSVRLTVKECEGETEKGLLLDGLLLTEEPSLQAVEAKLDRPWQAPRFAVHRGEKTDGVALTSSIDSQLTIALYTPDERPLPPAPYSDCSITNVYHTDLSGSRILRKLSNDSLLNWGSHNCQIHGDGGNHFCGYHAAPLFIQPGETREVYISLVCDSTGEQPAQALARAKAIYERRHEIEGRGREALQAWMREREGILCPNPYAFGQHRLMCNLLTNVTYPVYIRDGFYRTYTPGKRWGGLFTWDSGILGIGLMEYAPERAEEILVQYFADPQDADIDAVLHGTQLPLHIYLLFELYQRTGDLAMLKRHYKSALKYYRYFAGKSELSSYDKFGSGLLCPFEDGYNVEGIDDYPPQHYAGLVGAYDKISPVCTNAHAIRTGKLMQLLAGELGETGDIAEIDAWNEYLSGALQRYAWDPASGYFSYVWNESKEPLYYDEEKTINFNMGIDGASPLVAGILEANQLAKVCDNLMTPGRMWSDYGLVSVDQSAPYARLDGYWNGKVWMPHQWFFFKALVGEGRPEMAERIARKALEVWHRSVEDTYNCYEQFCSVTGMGEGCHNFGGLSAPVASFYHALYQKGRVTVGFDSLLRDVHFDEGSIRFALDTPMREKQTSALVCVGRAGTYRVCIGDACHVQRCDSELLVLQIDNPKGNLEISIVREGD